MGAEQVGGHESWYILQKRSELMLIILRLILSFSRNFRKLLANICGGSTFEIHKTTF